MSTNIGNGYRLAPGISVTDFVRSLDSTFSAARYAAYLRSIGELVLQLDSDSSESGRRKYLDFTTSSQVDLSRISLKSSRSSVSIAREILFNLQDSLQRRNATRAPFLDCTLSIAFLSDPENSDDVYALVFSENEEYVKVWESIEGVEEYFYWDGSDSQLATMTRKEWKARKKKWDKIIGGLRPIVNSVSWTLDMNPLYFMEFDDADVAISVANAKLRQEAALEWAKKIWGNTGMFGGAFDDDNGDDPDNGDDTSELVPR